MRSEGGDARVKVVIQFNEMPAALIDGVLSRFAARVTRKLSALNMRVIELPVNAVEALASQKEVRYLSPDRPIAMLGQLKQRPEPRPCASRPTHLLGGLINHKRLSSMAAALRSRLSIRASTSVIPPSEIQPG